MLTQIIKIATAALVLLVVFCLYCCLRVGSMADDWLEELELRKLQNEMEEAKARIIEQELERMAGSKTESEMSEEDSDGTAKLHSQSA